MSAPRPSVAAFRLAARALGALPAGADEVLSSALPPLDAPLPLADASPFDALPAADLAREGEERTHATESAPRRAQPAPEPQRRIQPQRAETATADTDGRRMDADRARRDAVAAFRQTGRALAAMPRRVDGLLASGSALRVLAPELPTAAATAFAGISEDALPTPASAADEERRGGRASSRDLARSARTPRAPTAPPAPRSAPRVTAAWSAADPAEATRAAAPGFREGASSPARPVHRLARRGGVTSERTGPQAGRHDQGTSTNAARPSSAPAASADPIASGRAAVDGSGAGRGDGAAFEHVSDAASTEAAPWDVDAFTRRAMAQGREADAVAARHAPASTPASLAEQADALGAGLRRVDELARRVMAAGARGSAARAESIHPSRQSNGAPEPRIHAPADPFAAWGAVARVSSTEPHPAGPAPESASGNPFAALLAPSAPVTAQSHGAVPDLAAHALTHSRTPHSALPHSGTDWHDDAAAPALDPAALADLVNDALVEQARLHGVDLS